MIELAGFKFSKYTSNLLNTGFPDKKVTYSVKYNFNAFKDIPINYLIFGHVGTVYNNKSIFISSKTVKSIDFRDIALPSNCKVMLYCPSLKRIRFSQQTLDKITIEADNLGSFKIDIFNPS